MNIFMKNSGKQLPFCQPSKLIIIIKLNVTENVPKGGYLYFFLKLYFHMHRSNLLEQGHQTP